MKVMHTETIQEIWNNPDKLYEVSLDILDDICSQFPFNSTFKIWAAKKAKHINHPNKDKYIQMASFYSSDRSFFKNTISQIFHVQKAESVPLIPKKAPVKEIPLATNRVNNPDSGEKKDSGSVLNTEYTENNLVVEDPNFEEDLNIPLIQVNNVSEEDTFDEVEQQITGSQVVVMDGTVENELLDLSSKKISDLSEQITEDITEEVSEDEMIEVPVSELLFAPNAISGPISEVSDSSTTEPNDNQKGTGLKGDVDKAEQSKPDSSGGDQNDFDIDYNLPSASTEIGNMNGSIQDDNNEVFTSIQNSQPDSENQMPNSTESFFLTPNADPLEVQSATIVDHKVAEPLTFHGQAKSRLSAVDLSDNDLNDLEKMMDDVDKEPVITLEEGFVSDFSILSLEDGDEIFENGDEVLEIIPEKIEVNTEVELEAVSDLESDGDEYGFEVGDEDYEGDLDMVDDSDYYEVEYEEEQAVLEIEKLSDFGSWLESLKKPSSRNELTGENNRSIIKARKKRNVSPDSGAVSETLAEILVKQQHYDKAIIMYSKLKLLFPEKSTYFAERIDKLNKLK